MQTFESGGALWVNPRAALRTTLMAMGIAAAAVALPPIFGIYLLIVA